MISITLWRRTCSGSLGNARIAYENTLWALWQPGGEVLLTCPENFSKRNAGGQRIFWLLSRQHPYLEYVLSTGDWVGKQTPHPIKDVDLWAGLLLFHIQSIPAVANREDLGLCKSSNMFFVTELNLLMSCNHYWYRLILQEINSNLRKKDNFKSKKAK